MDKTASSYGFAWKFFWKGMFDRQDVFGLNFAETGEYFLQSVGLKAADMKGLRVLDAGTGSGRVPYAIAGFGCDVVSVDMHDGLDAIAAQFKAQPNVRFVKSDLLSTP